MPQCLLKAVCHLFKIGILAVFLSKINKQKIIIFSLFHTVFQNSNSPFSFYFIVCLLFCFMTFYFSIYTVSMGVLSAVQSICVICVVCFNT